MDNLFVHASTVLDDSLDYGTEFGKIIKLPDSLASVEQFEYHLLPDGAFADHVKDISERMQCPPDYVAVATMVMLGSVIGRSHQIQPKEHDNGWIVVPNLWGLIIGKPSQLKTPALDSVLTHLKRADNEAREKFEFEIKTFEHDKEFQKAERDHNKKQVATLFKNNKPDEARALIESQTEIEPPTRKSYFINDSTTEKLGELLSENSNGLLVHRDELFGFLKTIDSEQRPNDRAFYLEGFNGTGSYRYDRIGRGTIDIKNHVLSLIGTIQPGRFASYVHQAIRQGSGDDGFSQRFQLAVYPNEPTIWENVDRQPNHDATNAVYSVIKKLVDMADTEEPIILRFSPEAQLIFNDWRHDLENTKLLNSADHPAILAHLAKYRSLLPSLALIIHLADTCSGEISDVTEIAIMKACGWCDYLESHARRIYSDAINNPVKAARLILTKIENGKLSDDFTARDVYRNKWTGLTDKDEVKEGLEMLVDHCYLLAGTKATAGRHSVTHRINPRIFEDGHHG